MGVILVVFTDLALARERRAAVIKVGHKHSKQGKPCVQTPHRSKSYTCFEASRLAQLD